MNTDIVEVTYECPECGEESDFKVVLPTPPPPALDHDDPNFSNPGSEPRVEGPSKCSCEYVWDDVDYETIIDLAMDS